MTADISAIDTMVLITYSRRRGGDDAVYENWLREVDNPFFNSVPGIAHYTNWKFVENVGPEVPFSHFDFLELDDVSAVEPVWANPDVVAFRAGWHEMWALEPTSDPVGDTREYASSQHYLCTRLTPSAHAMRSNVIFLAAGDGGGPSGFETWEIMRVIKGGELPFRIFCRTFIESPEEFEAMTAGLSAGLGELIASPD